MKSIVVGAFLLVGSIVYSQEGISGKIHNEEYFKIRQSLAAEEMKIFDKVIHEKYNSIDLNNTLIEDMAQNEKLSQDEKNEKIENYRLQNQNLEKEIKEEMDKFIARMNKQQTL